MIIITRAFMGARDLWNGIPNFKDALVKDVITGPDNGEFTTTLILKTPAGIEHKILISKAD